MIVPEYWAEARIQKREADRQITVRRFGWSDLSQDDAQANANNRAQEAYDRVASGEKLVRREPKVPYNGADGLPIREEILDRHGEAVITRNIYGAHCLNTPNVLFADVDFAFGRQIRVTCSAYLMLLAAAIAYGIVDGSWRTGIFAAVAAVFLGSVVADLLHGLSKMVLGGAEKRSYRRVTKFAQAHPDWHLRLYRTPAGFRILVMQQIFDPADPQVKACFEALGTDPVYVRMCLNQRCFRARVSPKPWRIGISQHMRPRPGVWPVDPERLPIRQQWVENYEAKARAYASCRYVETFGHASPHPTARMVQEIHDELCHAHTQLPLA